MSTLDDIKKRADGAAEARLILINALDESEEKALSTTAAFIAEQSSYDVPKLVAALEAVETLAVELIEKNQHDTSFQAWGLRVAGRQVRKAIAEALA